MLWMTSDTLLLPLYTQFLLADWISRISKKKKKNVDECFTYRFQETTVGFLFPKAIELKELCSNLNALSRPACEQETDAGGLSCK